MRVYARIGEPQRKRGEMTRKLRASVGLSVLLAVQGVGVGQVGQVWRDNQDFATDADTATVVETLLDVQQDVAVLSVGTVTASSGRKQIVVHVYRDLGGSVDLRGSLTIPRAGDPSAWFDLDFIATDAHASPSVRGLAICGYAVDPSTGDEVAMAACYKLDDLDDNPPLDRTWARLLDDVEGNSRATAVDSAVHCVAVTGWIDSGGSTGRDYLTYLLGSIGGGTIVGWPAITDRSDVDEAVDIVMFGDCIPVPGAMSAGAAALGPEPGPLTEPRIVVTGTTNPATSKADITTVGYDLDGVQKWSKTVMGTFGSQQAYDTAAAMSGALWKSTAEPEQEWWGAYVSGTSATATDAIPPASDILTIAWNAMDGRPIWGASGSEPAGVRRFDSGNGADDRAFANAVSTRFLDGPLNHDPVGLWVVGQTPRSNVDQDLDFFIHRYDLATGNVPSSWPSAGKTIAGGGDEDDIALAVSVHDHEDELSGDARSRITGYGWSDTSTSIDFMTISLKGTGAFTTDTGYPIFLDESGQGTDAAVSVIHHPTSENDFFVLGTTTRTGSLPLDVTTVKYRDTLP